jgi:hypothetical protein
LTLLRVSVFRNPLNLTNFDAVSTSCLSLILLDVLVPYVCELNAFFFPYVLLDSEPRGGGESEVSRASFSGEADWVGQ